MSPADLAKIDAMSSEDEMDGLHLDLGMYIRNNWGLWHESPLAQHMASLGFTDPDDMSGVILATFWCKRHGRAFRLDERAAQTAARAKASRQFWEEEKQRVERVKRQIRSLMMNVRLESRKVDEIRLPARVDGELIPRHFASYGNGVLVTVKRYREGDYFKFATVPYFLSGSDRTLHEVRIPEVPQIESVAAAGGSAWMVGANGSEPVLIELDGKTRRRHALPRTLGLPQLGVASSEVLAIYPDALYRLRKTGWDELYRGTLQLPRAGPPSFLSGGRLYLRDEGVHGNQMRLWELRLGRAPTLESLDRAIGLVGPSGPAWVNVLSYLPTDSGALWACVGEGYAAKTLLFRSASDEYAVAVMNNSVRFTPDLLGSDSTDQGLSVSAMTLASDGSLLLFGDAGFFRLKGNVLRRELAFLNTDQKIPINGGKDVLHSEWTPTAVLALNDHSFLLGGLFGGLFVLQQGNDGIWAFDYLDQRLGEPIDW